MSYYTSIRTPTAAGGVRRSGLLGIVLLLHGGLLALLLAARTVLPSLAQSPLMVEFFAPKPVEVAAPPAAKASPAVPATRRAAVAKPAPLPKPQLPVLETSTSSEPAPASAPVAAATNPVAASSAASGGDGHGTSSTGSGEGTVVGARFDADYLKNPAPPYPPQSRRLGEEGRSVLRVFVGADGSAQQVEIKTSSGSSRLDDSALRTVRGWRFVPAKRGGVAVDSWVIVPIVFKLEQ